jgi:hypothetical protein
MAVQHMMVWDEVDDFFTSMPTPEQILEFRPSQQAQERMRYLLNTHREGRLTADEMAELDQYLAIDMFVSRLKVKAMTKISR